MVDLSKVKNSSQWLEMRQEVEASVLQVIGQLPKDRVELQMKTVDEIEYPGYVRRRVNFFVDSWDRIAAWLFIPEGKEEIPAILCCHQEIRSGKDEPAGLDGESRLAFAQHYAELGYVTLAPDTVLAGDRLAAKKTAYDSKGFYKDNNKLSLAGKMLSDHLQAMDVFTDMKRVDPARVGVVGHGLGAFNALLLAAFDDRVRACVASCGFTRFATDKEPERWLREELKLMPALEPYLESKEFPFDWEHILALAAPSAVLAIASLNDGPLANPKSVQKAVTLANPIYKVLGASSALSHYGHHDGHRVTPETQELADEWFDRWL